MDSILLPVPNRPSDAARRASAVAQYLPTVAALSRMVDQLCELHADLDADDRLQQVLHSLGFCWQYVEAELHEAAGRGKN
jgi:hypothetical protein